MLRTTNTDRAITTPPTDTLHKRIVRFENDYQAARLTHTAFFTQHIWRTFSGRNKVDMQNMKKLQKDIAQLIKEATDIQALLITNQLYDNLFFLTKVKLKVLACRVLISSNQLIEGFTEIGSIINLLTTLQNRRGFTCAHDLQFQQEVAFIFSITDMMPENDQLTHTPVYLAFTALAYQLTKKWPPTIHKLSIDYNYWFCPKSDTYLRVNDMSLADRTEFSGTHEVLVKDIKKQLASHPTDATASIYYAMANILAYQLEHVTHPHSIFKQKIKRGEMISTPSDITDVKKYIKFIIGSFTKHLLPSVKQLLKANPQSLQQNGELVPQLSITIECLCNEAEKLIFNFWHIRKDFNLPEDLIHDLTLAEMNLIDFITDTQEVIYYFKLDDSKLIASKMTSVRLNQDMVPEVRQIMKEQKTTCIENENKKRLAKELLADKNATFLIDLDEAEKKSFNTVNMHLKNPKKKNQKKHTKPDEAANNTLHYFTRAQYFARNRHHHEAVDMYELAYNDAIQSNDLYLRLAAMDGQLFVQCRMLSQKIKIARATLTSHINSFKIISPNRQHEAAELTKEIAIGLEKLCQLEAQYTSLTYQPSVNDNHQISDGINTSKAILRELISNLKDGVSKTEQLFTELNEKFKNRTKKYIRFLGLNAIKDVKDHTVSLDEIDYIGLGIYRNIGIEKHRLGIKLSAHTREKRHYDDLAKTFATASAKFTNLAEKYKEDAKGTDIHSRPALMPFEVVKDVRCEKLLVGSCVALDVSNGDISNAPDYDFVIARKDEPQLINGDFHHPIYQPNTYQRAKPKKTDISIIKDLSDATLLEDAKSRDFTMCAVYQRENGTKIDPLGTGIDDAANRRLRMIGDPAVRLAEDPARVLRAVRYMVPRHAPNQPPTPGYAPDQPLINALKSLAVPEARHQTHLIALVKKHFGYRDLNRKEYIVLMHEYGLLEKLFGIPYKMNADIALWQLEKLLDIKKPKIIKHTHIFAHTDDFPALKKEENKSINDRPNIKGLILA